MIPPSSIQVSTGTLSQMDKALAGGGVTSAGESVTTGVEGPVVIAVGASVGVEDGMAVAGDVDAADVGSTDVGTAAWARSKS